ncbi:hypothetical protein N7448_002094 [Penicillium atrosanguineum]|uniref:WD-like domain-containing protein n=1 Tax=Penicillium atrosanguineum TaxID=1132637 RepID=A0A9W9U323_9EURO|nr:uncharacterized protein N7443_005497 [Penicillium atrosanguineum]KAJ5128376.1 hypothetical protein N7526_006542 [Penicillium atrosanguineum]KAJ5144702.1 hypothetical protein N7448_002094 [Penicillium atrosanguineum]KAJ5300495.1 hypothetical protein N7443_005497 [Penicillium atrosanguineum]KAJ5311138.1 hypothetical protein N7476_006998 [Penicillium atrosanguineum]
MLSSTIIAGLFLGLAQIPGSVAQPFISDNSTDIIITHVASDFFPNAKGDLSPFDVDVQYVGYDADTRLWLTALEPGSGTTDKEKAVLLTEAAYAKKFDESDSDMVEDVSALLAAVAGNTSSLEKRAGSSYSLSARHAINWGKCAAALSCLSGTTCRFNLNIGSAPRSRCESQGGSNCCISWSTYHVRAGFFSTTWTSCNSEVNAEKKASVSCEGHGSSAQGGDVCLSGRANGCT